MVFDKYVITSSLYRHHSVLVDQRFVPWSQWCALVLRKICTVSHKSHQVTKQYWLLCTVRIYYYLRLFRGPGSSCLRERPDSPGNAQSRAGSWEIANISPSWINRTTIIMQWLTVKFTDEFNRCENIEVLCPLFHAADLCYKHGYAFYSHVVESAGLGQVEISVSFPIAGLWGAG